MGGASLLENQTRLLVPSAKESFVRLGVVQLDWALLGAARAGERPILVPLPPARLRSHHFGRADRVGRYQCRARIGLRLGQKVALSGLVQPPASCSARAELNKELNKQLFESRTESVSSTLGLLVSP